MTLCPSESLNSTSMILKNNFLLSDTIWLQKGVDLFYYKVTIDFIGGIKTPFFPPKPESETSFS